MMLTTSTFLRRALVADAAISGATAVLLVLGGGVLAQPLAVPESLLRYAGVVLIPFAMYVGLVARRDAVPRASVLAIIGLNVAWVVASLWLVLRGPIQPNLLGYAFIVGQAVAVAVFAELQYVGLRRVGLERSAA